MTVWLVLFLRLQARTSWERETLSLSAIWGEYRQTFPIYFYVLEVQTGTFKRSESNNIFYSHELHRQSPFNIEQYFLIRIVDCPLLGPQSSHLFLVELLFQPDSSIFASLCTSAEVQSSHSLIIWRSNILYRIEIEYTTIHTSVCRYLSISISSLYRYSLKRLNSWLIC